MTLTTTFHHLFYDITQSAFVQTSNVHQGDVLQPIGDETVTVTDVRLYDATAVTYDLTIDGPHTYYVETGAMPILVHNVDEDRLCDLTLGLTLKG